LEYLISDKIEKYAEDKIINDVIIKQENLDSDRLKKLEK